MRNKLLWLALLFISLTANASSPDVFPDARDKGTLKTCNKTVSTALAATKRNGWCLIADKDNTDKFRFRLGSDASTTVGVELQAGDSFCDPIAGGAVYTGIVTVAAESTAATVNYYTLSY